MDKSILEEAGLTEGEAVVYITLLEIGSSTAGPIIKKSGLHRATTYSILQRLIEKGLASSIVKGKKRYFEASDPHALLDALKEKEEKIRSILPELSERKRRSKTVQEVTVYEGLKGIKTVRERALRTLKKGETLYVLGANIVTTERLQSYWKLFHPRRIKAGIKTKMLWTEESDFSRKIQDMPLTEVKYLPSTFPGPIYFDICKDVTGVAILSEKPIRVEIKNKDVADSFRNYFDVLWNQDVKTFSGEEEVKAAFQDILHTLKDGDEYCVFGIPKMEDKFNKFFQNFYQKRGERGIKIKALFNADAKGIASQRAKAPLTDARMLPQGLSFPAVFSAYKNKTLINLWTRQDKAPLAFSIENPEIAESVRNYFNVLWNQDVQIYRGFEEVTNMYRSRMRSLDKGDEYYVLGSTYGKHGTMLQEFFFDFDVERVKKGIRLKLLSTAKEFQTIQKDIRNAADPALRLTRIASLPPGMHSPMQITILKKEAILVFLGKNPIAFSIADRRIRDGFKAYFDQLWELSQINTKTS